MATGLANAPVLTGDRDAGERLIRQQLSRAGQYVKWVELGSQLLTLLVATLLFFLGAALIDHWLFSLGTFGRWFLLLALVGGAGWFLATRVLPLFIRAVNPKYSAWAIEEATPSLKNSLLNFLLLKDDKAAVKESVLIALEQRAASDIAQVEIDSTIDRAPLIRVGYVLCGVLAFVALYKIASPKDPFQTAARVVAPWADLARPSRVLIREVQPGHTSVYLGSVVEISADVQGVRKGDEVKLVYSSADGQVQDRVVPMKAAAGRKFVATLPAPDESDLAKGKSNGLQQGVLYHIAAGDALSSIYEIRVRMKPTITVERAELVFPSYTQKPSQTQDSGEIKALEGTRVTIHARANQPIKTALLELDPRPGRAGETIALQVEGQQASGSFTLQLKPDRVSPWRETYQVRFTNEQGEVSEQPVLHKLDVQPDLPPEVEILAPQQTRIDVTEDGKLTIEARGVDPDFALAELSLAGKSGEREVFKSSLLPPGEPRSQASGKFEFIPAQLDLKAGDVVKYQAFVADNRRNPLTGQPQPGRAQTSEYTIQIIPARKPNPNQAGNPNPNQQNNPNPMANPGEKPMPMPGENPMQKPEPKPGEKPNQKPGEKPNDPKNNQQPKPNENGQQGNQQNGGQNENGQGQNGQNQQNQGSKPMPGQGANNQQNNKPGEPPPMPGQNDSGSGSGQQGTGQNQAGEGQNNTDPNGTGGQKSNQPNGQPNPSGNSREPGSPDPSNQNPNEQGSDPAGNPGQQTGNPGGENAQPGSNNQQGNPGGGKPEHDGQKFEEVLKQLKEKLEKEKKNQAGQGNNQPGQQIPNENPSGQAQEQPGGANQNNGQQNSGQKQPGGKPMPGQTGASQPKESTDATEQQLKDIEKMIAEEKKKNGQQPMPGEKGTETAQNNPMPMPMPDPNGQPNGAGQRGKPQPMPGGNQPMPGAQQQPGTNGAQQPMGGKPMGEPMTGDQPGTPQNAAGQKPGEKTESGSPQGPMRTDEGKDPKPGEGEKKNPGAGKTGDPGAGSQSKENTGSGQAYQKNQDKPKDMNSGNQGDQNANEASPPSSSPKQSDSQGATSGEQSGGGKQGAGQPGGKGNDTPGKSSPGDQGAGAANEKGNGETGSKAGKVQEAAGKTGQSGNKPGEGTSTRPDKAGNEQGKTGEGSKDPSDPRGQKPAGKNGEGPGQAGGPPTGGGKPGDRSSQGITENSADAADEANLNYTRKVTDLVLQHLKDQEHNPDPELAKKMQLTPQELQEFSRRWSQLKEEAAKDPNKARELDEALRSLGMKDPKNRRRAGAGTNDKVRDLRDSGSRTQAPSKYREQFDQFRKNAGK